MYEGSFFSKPWIWLCITIMANFGKRDLNSCEGALVCVCPPVVVHLSTWGPIQYHLSPSNWQADFHHKSTWTTQNLQITNGTKNYHPTIVRYTSSYCGPLLSRCRQTRALKTNQQTIYCLPTTMVFQFTKLVIFLCWLHWKVKYLIVFERFGRICLWTGSKSC